MSVYLDLTREFNQSEVRAIICSGQAVVLHRLAIMSKDGDWILREEARALEHVLSVLARRGARYRFGAPLDLRWMQGGWSAHLQFQGDGLRIRTDFFTRPPRISAADRRRMWSVVGTDQLPVTGLRDLATMKQTNRERDYAVIGELARRMVDPLDQLLFSRSARDLIDLGRRYPDHVRSQLSVRPVLGVIAAGRDELERALDAERRQLMRANEDRIARYLEAATAWAAMWPEVEREIGSLDLFTAHAVMVERATGVLPRELADGGPDA